jgi:hypothetical protein
MVDLRLSQKPLEALSKQKSGHFLMKTGTAALHRHQITSIAIDFKQEQKEDKTMPHE